MSVETLIEPKTKISHEATYRFSCGCELPILGHGPTPDGTPLLDYDRNSVPEDCPAVWKMLAEGKTTGIFQLESSLGRQWCQKLKPESLDHLGALGALLRPGPLKAKNKDGVSLTEQYCLRKNGVEEVKSFHPVVDEILAPTYNVLCYQEQSLLLGSQIAGLDPVQCDKLRKGIGKKDVELLNELKILFLEGCEREKVVNKDEAEEVWSWIQATGRYQFNASHSISYGVTGYDTAWEKAHFPLLFYTGWLRFCKSQGDTVPFLMEAKMAGIEIACPSLLDRRKEFFPTGDRVIHFGLTNVREVGEAQVEKLLALIKEGEELLKTPLEEWTPWELFIVLANRFSNAVLRYLIQAGALDFLGLPRTRLRKEWEILHELTNSQLEWLLALEWIERGWVTPNEVVFPEGREGLTERQIKNRERDAGWLLNSARSFDGVVDALKSCAKMRSTGGICSRTKDIRKLQDYARLLENPPRPLQDSPHWVSWTEAHLLGISITYHKTDACDTSDVNTTCLEFANGADGYMVFGVEIDSVRVSKVKNENSKNFGKEMAFLTVSDASGQLRDVVCFANVYAEINDVLREGSCVVLHGERDERNSKQLLVQNAWRI